MAKRVAMTPDWQDVNGFLKEGIAMKRLTLALFGGCLVLAASASVAEDRNKDNTDQPITDEQFVLKASEAGLAEVNHGNLAAQKANNADVKQFGQRMVKDHTKANQELVDLADKQKFKVAQDMGEKHKAMQEKLSGLSGAAFDRHYMQHMVEGHEKVIALFKSEAKNGKDADLRTFAEKTLPTLQEHLKMARQIHDQLKDQK